MVPPNVTSSLNFLGRQELLKTFQSRPGQDKQRQRRKTERHDLPVKELMAEEGEGGRSNRQLRALPGLPVEPRKVHFQGSCGSTLTFTFHIIK